MREPTGCTAAFRRREGQERGAGSCLGAVILLSAVTALAGWPGNASAAAKVWADFNPISNRWSSRGLWPGGPTVPLAAVFLCHARYGR